MRTADVIVVGAGVIGLSLALELRKTGASVLVLERGEPAREATHAAAGMLAPHGGDLPRALQTLADASAKMFSEFVQEIEDASRMRVDLRAQGTILAGAEAAGLNGARYLNEQQLSELEPHLAPLEGACFIEEASVDPRALGAALMAAALHHGIHVASGSEVTEIEKSSGAFSVRTTHSSYSAAAVVNCGGAWAGQIGPVKLPTRPFKGQMLSVVSEKRDLLTHVVRSDRVYLVSRSDGRILIGATVEDIGFDKRVDPAVIKNLHHLAAELVPKIGNARIHEAWAGLRPGTADDLPIIGATSVPGSFIATGHFRNGILLAPVTAKVMAAVIGGKPAPYAIDVFASSRFSS